MNSLKDLQDKGYRITRQRKNLLNQIGSNPQTAEEIFDSLKKKGQRIDRVSVYRGLEFFVREGIIQEVNFGDGKKRYELLDENNHHHHFICDSCGDIEDVELKEKELLMHIKKDSHFKIQRHELEFFGLCANCL